MSASRGAGATGSASGAGANDAARSPLPAPRGALPDEAELRAFAEVAALLLGERRARASSAAAPSRRPGIGLQHLDHRDYQPGDEVRHIDWRQTARARRPIVRRFEAESATDWTILLDASSSMSALGGGKWRAAVHAAAAMSYALLHNGHRVGLVVFGTRVLAECARGRGRQHYAAIARLLCGLRPTARGERSALGACAPALRAAASVFAIGDFLAADEMRAELATLRRACGELHVLQLRSADDTRLGAAGELELVDVETGARLAARIGAGDEAQAAAARRAMTLRLGSFCRRVGVAFTDWNVADGWQQTLVRHLAQARSRC
ncbi:MAG: DUF58 domain-containing protein [Burkholderiales bacterium]|nr:DUF58 domain-containing protein [Burkholderiales bacterium]